MCIEFGTLSKRVSLPITRCWPVPWTQPATHSERQFWRVRDVDLLEVPLDDYVGALGRYVGVATAEAPA